MDYQKWGQIPMFNDEEVLYEQLKDLLKHSIDPTLKPTLKGMRCSLTPPCGHSQTVVKADKSRRSTLKKFCLIISKKFFLILTRTEWPLRI